jgi:phage terminase small subunit
MQPIEPQTVQHHPASAVGLTPNQPEQCKLRWEFWKQHQEFKLAIGALKGQTAAAPESCMLMRIRHVQGRQFEGVLRVKFNRKQALFVDEYLIDLNATQAAIRAGYSQRSAPEQGYDNLRKPHIAAAIQAAMDRRSAKLEITAEAVLQETAKLGFANMLDYVAVDERGSVRVNLSRLTRDQASAIIELTVEETVERASGSGASTSITVRRTKFRLADKLGALEKLGKHLKLFTEKMETSVDVNSSAESAKQQLMERLNLL